MGIVVNLCEMTNQTRRRREKKKTKPEAGAEILLFSGVYYSRPTRWELKGNVQSADSQSKSPNAS